MSNLTSIEKFSNVFTYHYTWCIGNKFQLGNYLAVLLMLHTKKEDLYQLSCNQHISYLFTYVSRFVNIFNICTTIMVNCHLLLHMMWLLWIYARVLFVTPQYYYMSPWLHMYNFLNMSTSFLVFNNYEMFSYITTLVEN